MPELTWLPLTEYSSKYKVSVSTLRRKIKAEDIKYSFNDGKYLILDVPPLGTHRAHRPSQNDDSAPVSAPQTINGEGHVGPSLGRGSGKPIPAFRRNNMMAGRSVLSVDEAVEDSRAAFGSRFTSINGGSEPVGAEEVINETNKLLTDLKQAYTKILQEKEQTISKLRSELADLKTLVQILEEEHNLEP